MFNFFNSIFFFSVFILFVHCANGGQDNSFNGRRDSLQKYNTVLQKIGGIEENKFDRQNMNSYEKERRKLSNWGTTMTRRNESFSNSTKSSNSGLPKNSYSMNKGPVFSTSNYPASTSKRGKPETATSGSFNFNEFGSSFSNPCHENKQRWFSYGVSGNDAWRTRPMDTLNLSLEPLSAQMLRPDLSMRDKDGKYVPFDPKCTRLGS